MRAYPAAQFSLTRFGVWHTAVSLLAALVAATLAPWLAAQPGWPGGGLSACAAGLAIGLAAWWPLRALHPPGSAWSLRWDAQCWHLGPADTTGHEPATGDVSVEVDFGSWMLLRFRPEMAGVRLASTWLPVQRRGLEGQWHSLRCALYSPRPDVGVDSSPDV